MALKCTPSLPRQQLHKHTFSVNQDQRHPPLHFFTNSVCFDRCWQASKASISRHATSDTHQGICHHVSSATNLLSHLVFGSVESSLFSFMAVGTFIWSTFKFYTPLFSLILIMYFYVHILLCGFINILCLQRDYNHRVFYTLYNSFSFFLKLIGSNEGGIEYFITAWKFRFRAGK